jgi:plasmid stabilization system protein ParE
MSYSFHPSAEAELEEAENYYDAIDTALGNRFRAEFEASVERILGFPNAWQSLSKSIRRRRFTSFPYGVVYRVMAKEIRILAIMHLHRSPGYWKNRT